MTERVYNFSAGPATLPLAVLAEAQRDLRTLPGVGAGPLEVSHRSPWFRGVIGEAEANLRRLLTIPDTHHVLFCQGGASLQFSMVAMNLLRGTERPAGYVITGAWGTKALAEAAKEGDARAVWSGADNAFVTVPSARELASAVSAGAVYIHVTTNETIQGVQFPDDPPAPAGVPLVADMSSDFCSRPVDVGRYTLIYAGAQKNAGPAGVAVAIVGDDVLAGAPHGLPTMLDYRTYAEHGSLYNTPPVFSIYVMRLVMTWLLKNGGLGAVEAANKKKADTLYAEIDRTGFYRGHAAKDSRSRMNVTFRLPSEDLEKTFAKEATAAGLDGLKGHRSVGGMRASIYNAFPEAGVQALVDFMREFERKNG